MSSNPTMKTIIWMRLVSPLTWKWFIISKKKKTWKWFIETLSVGCKTEEAWCRWAAKAWKFKILIHVLGKGKRSSFFCWMVIYVYILRRKGTLLLIWNWSLFLCLNICIRPCTSFRMRTFEVLILDLKFDCELACHLLFELFIGQSFLIWFFFHIYR